MPPFPIPRTRPDAPAEIRGPCRTNRQDSVTVVAFATSYALRAVPPLPPRTTNYVLRTHKADTRVRPYDEKNHELRATATGHEPQATG